MINLDLADSQFDDIFKRTRCAIQCANALWCFEGLDEPRLAVLQRSFSKVREVGAEAVLHPLLFPDPLVNEESRL